jgi:hypothetical protein
MMAGVLGIWMLAHPGSAWAQVITRSHTGKIAGWQLSENGNFSVLFEGAPTLCSNGAGGNNQRAAVALGFAGVTEDGRKMMYATVLAAFLAGKTVTVYVKDGETSGGWGCATYALDVSH